MRRQRPRLQPHLDPRFVPRTMMNLENCPPGWLEGPYDETKPPWEECRLDGRTTADLLPRDPTPVEWTGDDQPKLL